MYVFSLFFAFFTQEIFKKTTYTSVGTANNSCSFVLCFTFPVHRLCHVATIYRYIKSRTFCVAYMPEDKHIVS